MPPRSLVQLMTVIFALGFSAVAGAVDDEFVKECVASAAKTAEHDVTIGQLREQCIKEALFAEQYPIERRAAIERKTATEPFVMTPHRPNYLLFASYNFDDYNEAPFRQQFGTDAEGFEKLESKFQISIKSSIADDVWREGDGFFVGYTMRAFWQVWENNGLSKPVRDYNHEPEFWYSYPIRWNFPGYRFSAFRVGLNHQSNGRGGTLSRSWNRYFAQFLFEKDRGILGLKLWGRIDENANSDDNPDITEYMGNFELFSVYKRSGHSFSVMLRNNLDRSKNYGAYQLDWSFPLHKRLRGYVQWFSGYGESLIDYNHRVNTLGIGIQLTDWL